MWTLLPTKENPQRADAARAEAKLLHQANQRIPRASEEQKEACNIGIEKERREAGTRAAEEMAAIPTALKRRPYSKEDKESLSRPMRGRKAQMQAERIFTLSWRIMIQTRGLLENKQEAPLWKEERNFERDAGFFWVGVWRCLTANRVAIQEAAFKKTTEAAPEKATKKPPKAGPTDRATLKLMLLRETALARRFFGRTS